MYLKVLWAKNPFFVRSQVQRAVGGGGREVRAQHAVGGGGRLPAGAEEEDCHGAHLRVPLLLKYSGT